MADSFEVLLFDAAGKACQIAGRGLLLSGAISLCRGVNDHRKPGDLTAVVLPEGSFGQMCVDDLEAPQIDSDATSEQDDSEVEPGAEDAPESNVEDDLFDDVASRRANFVQRELKRQLKRIWGAVPLVTDGADLGIVAASLEVVSRAVDGVCEEDLIHERFDYGLHGDLRYTELENALGVVRRDVHELKSRVLG